LASAEKGVAFLDSVRQAKAADRFQDEPEARNEDALWPAALDLEALSGKEPEPPRFIMPDWLPCGYATLFAGHGGVGKSGIALHLAVCIASGTPFFGMEVEQRRVLYLSCEDRESVLHWRLARITAHLGLSLASLRGQLEIIDLVGEDTLLWERARDGTTLAAPWFELKKRMRAYQTEVLFVDGISDTYGGNENAKTEVKRYVNCLVKLIDAERGCVVLIGHIAKPTASGVPTSEGYSGTTGWHNSVRARWYLYPETQQAEDGGRPEKTGELLLELQKSNLGKMDQSIRFNWDEDKRLFIGQSASLAKFDRKHQERTEQAGILRAFASCAAESIVVPAAMQGPRTALHILCHRAEFPDTLMGQGAGKAKRFRRHIEELRQIRYIEEGEYRRTNRHAGAQLVLTAEGMRQCAK
jgi:RecA-family ATPase